jgi:hypothetical protein
MRKPKQAIREFDRTHRIGIKPTPWREVVFSGDTLRESVSWVVPPPPTPLEEFKAALEAFRKRGFIF